MATIRQNDLSVWRRLQSDARQERRRVTRGKMCHPNRVRSRARRVVVRRERVQTATGSPRVSAQFRSPRRRTHTPVRTSRLARLCGRDAAVSGLQRNDGCRRRPPVSAAELSSLRETEDDRRKASNAISRDTNILLPSAFEPAILMKREEIPLPQCIISYETVIKF